MLIFKVDATILIAFGTKHWAYCLTVRAFLYQFKKVWLQLSTFYYLLKIEYLRRNTALLCS
jgi:hypothetical protein